MASKRRFFRLHLSSVVLAVLAAGIVLGLNLRPRSVTTNGAQVISDRAYVSAEFGWPETCFFTFPNVAERTLWDQCKAGYQVQKFIWQIERVPQLPSGSTPVPSFIDNSWLWVKALEPLSIDVATGCLIVLAVMVLNEWRIRRLSGPTHALPREKVV